MSASRPEKRFSSWKLVVASGATREWIDPVRYITNPSSGQTGWQLARAGADLFASVIYIVGSTQDKYAFVSSAQNISAESTIAMQTAVLNSLEEKTLLIMAAAPADFRIQKPSAEKLKKENLEQLTLTLVRNPDILLSVSEKRNSYKKMCVVGFAAETDNAIENAGRKLKAKQLDAICANSVYKTERGFHQESNQLTLLTEDCAKILGPASKAELAQILLRELSKLPVFSA